MPASNLALSKDKPEDVIEDLNISGMIKNKHLSKSPNYSHLLLLVPFLLQIVFQKNKKILRFSQNGGFNLKIQLRLFVFPRRT